MATNKDGIEVTRSDPGNLHQKDERAEKEDRRRAAAMAVRDEANSPESIAAEALRMQALEEAHGDPVKQGEILERLKREAGEGVDQEAELRQRLAEDDGFPMAEVGARPSLSDALAAAAGEVLTPEEVEYTRVGECIFRWALIAAEDVASDDLQLLFQVLIDGEDDAGMLTIDVSQQRMATWRKGLQTVGGEEAFAAGLMEKLLQVATARMAENLRLCLVEVTHGALANGGHKDEAAAYEVWHTNKDAEIDYEAGDGV